jgi:hypothetical protein
VSIRDSPLAHTLKGTENFNIMSAIGVELREDLHEAFLGWMDGIEHAAPLLESALADIRDSFIVADMVGTCADALKVQAATRRADVIWCNTKLFPSELNNAISKMLAKHMSKSGAIVISASELECVSDNEAHELTLSERFMFPVDSMSWTPCSVEGFVSKRGYNYHIARSCNRPSPTGKSGLVNITTDHARQRQRKSRRHMSGTCGKMLLSKSLCSCTSATSSLRNKRTSSFLH